MWHTLCQRHITCPTGPPIRISHSCFSFCLSGFTSFRPPSARSAARHLCLAPRMAEINPQKHHTRRTYRCNGRGFGVAGTPRRCSRSSCFHHCCASSRDESSEVEHVIEPLLYLVERRLNHVLIGAPPHPSGIFCAKTTRLVKPVLVRHSGVLHK